MSRASFRATRALIASQSKFEKLTVVCKMQQFIFLLFYKYCYLYLIFTQVLECFGMWYFGNRFVIGKHNNLFKCEDEKMNKIPFMIVTQKLLEKVECLLPLSFYSVFALKIQTDNQSSQKQVNMPVTTLTSGLCLYTYCGPFYFHFNNTQIINWHSSPVYALYITEPC